MLVENFTQYPVKVDLQYRQLWQFLIVSLETALCPKESHCSHMSTLGTFVCSMRLAANETARLTCCPFFQSVDRGGIACNGASKSPTLLFTYLVMRSEALRVPDFPQSPYVDCFIIAQRKRPVYPKAKMQMPRKARTVSENITLTLKRTDSGERQPHVKPAVLTTCSNTHVYHHQ